MRIVDIVIAAAVLGAAVGLWQGSAAGLTRLLPATEANGGDEQRGSRCCGRLVWLRQPAVHAAHGRRHTLVARQKPPPWPKG